jgi:DNA-binding XRE family transcriptional regulator
VTNKITIEKPRPRMNLIMAMEERGWDIVFLAGKVNLSRKTVTRMRQGYPTLVENALAVANELGSTVEHLFGKNLKPTA